MLGKIIKFNCTNIFVRAIFVFISLFFFTMLNVYSELNSKVVSSRPPACPSKPCAKTGSLDLSPLSNVTIKSKKVICRKNSKDSKLFDFNYLENVVVTFADESSISSGSLKIVLDLFGSSTLNVSSDSKSCSKGKSKMSVAKKITFKNSVKFVRGNRTVTADKAKIFVDKNECLLIGNVKIVQTKQDSEDIPITTECDKATVNLKTEELVLEGALNKPVTTVLVIGEKTNIFKKINPKH